MPNSKPEDFKLGHYRYLLQLIALMGALMFVIILSLDGATSFAFAFAAIAAVFAILSIGGK